MRRHLGTFLGIVISVAALAVSVKGIPPVELRNAILGANYGFVVPAVLLLVVSYVFRAMRWRELLRAQVPLDETFHAMNAGYLLNNILPMRLGELGRAYLLSRSRVVPGAEALSTIAVERVIDLLTAAVVLAVTLPLVVSDEWMRSAGWSIGVFSVGGFVALIFAAHQRAWLVSLAGAMMRRLPRLDRRVAGLLARLDSFLGGLAALRDLRATLFALLWSTISWVLSGLVCWALLFSFIPAPTLLLGFFVLGAAAVGYALPSSPGQAGVLEAAVVAALVPLGVSQTTAFSYAVVLHIVSYAVTSVLGIWAISRYGESLSGLAQSAQSFIGKGNTADEKRTQMGSE